MHVEAHTGTCTHQYASIQNPVTLLSTSTAQTAVAKDTASDKGTAMEHQT